MRPKGSYAAISGSLTAQGGAAKVQNVTRRRHFFESVSRVIDSRQVLSASESPYPVGSQYVRGTFLFSLERLSANAVTWVQGYDRFRLTNVEIFATLVSRSKNSAIDRTAPVVLYFYEDTDADDSTTTSWVRTSDRDNLGRVVLHATNPCMKLISFQPTPSFTANSSSSQSPSNVIPRKNTWIDALSVAQKMSGLRFFGGSPQADASGQSYEFDVVFEVRYTVEVQQPL